MLSYHLIQTCGNANCSQVVLLVALLFMVPHGCNWDCNYKRHLATVSKIKILQLHCNCYHVKCMTGIRSASCVLSAVLPSMALTIRKPQIVFRQLDIKVKETPTFSSMSSLKRRTPFVDWKKTQCELWPEWDFLPKGRELAFANCQAPKSLAFDCLRGQLT